MSFEICYLTCYRVGNCCNFPTLCESISLKQICGILCLSRTAKCSTKYTNLNNLVGSRRYNINLCIIELQRVVNIVEWVCYLLKWYYIITLSINYSILSNLFKSCSYFSFDILLLSNSIFKNSENCSFVLFPLPYIL